MILSFKTQLNGKPTLFIEKIWEGFFRNDFFDGKDTEFIKYFDLHREKFGKAWDELPAVPRLETPKIHTIRKDEKNRWKPGMEIDFFINARQRNMFRFAPRIPLISRQRIFMTYMPHYGNGFEVSINGRQLGDDEILTLAINDGFESFDDFADYFIAEMEDHQFSGKILHWTDFKY